MSLKDLLLGYFSAALKSRRNRTYAQPRGLMPNALVRADDLWTR